MGFIRSGSSSVAAELADGVGGDGDGDVIVVEPHEGSAQGGEDGLGRSGIDLCCAFEQESGAVALRERVDVGEVAGFGAVEEGEQCASGEFFESETGAGDACFWWRVQRGVEVERRSSPVRTSRATVPLSWMRRIDHPRSAAAFSKASRAAGTVPRPCG